MFLLKTPRPPLARGGFVEGEIIHLKTTQNLMSTRLSQDTNRIKFPSYEP